MVAEGYTEVIETIPVIHILGSSNFQNLFWPHMSIANLTLCSKYAISYSL